MGASLQCSFKLIVVLLKVEQVGNSGAYEWNYLCRFSDKSMGEFLVERNQMCNIYIAVVLFKKNVLANLISVNRLADACSTS